ncbi:MAG: ADP-forming succinate--CoA ligase subunit beta [Candidatus Aminicenantes bacterium]|nr:ADP-forming succinate--CoA ligase subunit beta [Candidatus Aminicenantes bacterium]
MRLHEDQAKSILSARGIAVPRGFTASSAEEAASVAAQIGGPVVVKALILSGGRGKAGGVRTAQTPDEAGRIAAGLLSGRLVTSQTGPSGAVVRRVLIEESIPVVRETYLAMAVDRGLGRVVVLASGQGGMELEALAAASPQAVIRETVPIPTGPSSVQAEAIAAACGLAGPDAEGFTRALLALWRAFRDSDAGLIEINPLGLALGGGWLALDAKMILDDSALSRHPELARLRDSADDDPREAEAAAVGLSYVRLDGDIGCLVNGAGLAMATADIIEMAGGHPADFLDIGGGVGEDALREGYRIVASDPAVRAILINVFGGIVRCDLVASGVVRACRDFSLDAPLVVRMLGTNDEDGRRILAESGLAFQTAETMDEAAAKSVAAAAGARS